MSALAPSTGSARSVEQQGHLLGIRGRPARVNQPTPEALRVAGSALKSMPINHLGDALMKVD